MPLALNDDQIELADSVARFAERHRCLASIRADNRQYRSGHCPELWHELVSLGLHAVHLPENLGGQGGAITDVAVVIAATGQALVPGPLLPTVCASATVLSAHSHLATHDVLQRLSAGATAALLLPQPALTCYVRDGRVRLDGTAASVVGAAAADLLVVGAHDGDGDDACDVRWFVVERSSRGVDVDVNDGVDLGRDLATVRFDGTDVTDATPLLGIDAGYARDLLVGLMAVEAAGVIAWCSEAATAFVKSRNQFGRPVGAFQAVQHRVAQLRITSELATASAWDAVRSLSDNAAQRTHAVAAAAIVSLGRAVHAAVECLCLHGAIAFTWEHDVHLYWRRAIALAGLTGPVESWEARLGAVALGGPRNFTLTLPETDPAFRGWVGDVLDKAMALQNPMRSRIGDSDAAAIGPRRTLLAEEGLVAPGWPRPYGLGATPLQQLIVTEEFDRRGLAQPTMAIGQWVLPVVLNHGTPEQIEAVAGPTLRGELIWCQLFSEPEAGSDVASLALAASQTEGGWILRGQKVWTTQAHLADMGLCLARTGGEGSKHRGLSMFLIDMRNPELEVRPIKQANSEAEFNEVFFNDVFVPDSMLLGAPGQGWALTLDTLAQERLFIGTYRETGNETRLRQIIANNQYAGSRDDAVRTLGRISAQGAAIAAMNVRETLRRLQGLAPGPATSIGKAAASMLHVDAAAAALNLIGPAAALNETSCEAVFHELDIPTWVIGGGTLEIQLNTIATFVLGLPRS
ncbi:acyl-CoA dehydrogenase [Mycobacterium terramassiliense]|uniref:Acyl-CoA dehydrogenase n=1 Tax=Mycobacterium terramassiliense TaxID=1841859 RepID=A0A2U3NGI6_9MYCO|nr:acyl-CoA dehydrogenase [Mycobacterium terramassiliense]SPM30545.1 acyl-CoA dehydrogenase [Mycobacterium terramassiliense]